MWAIPTYGVTWSVCLSVCVLGTTVSSAKRLIIIVIIIIILTPVLNSQGMKKNYAKRYKKSTKIKLE